MEDWLMNTCTAVVHPDCENEPYCGDTMPCAKHSHGDDCVICRGRGEYYDSGGQRHGCPAVTG